MMERIILDFLGTILLNIFCIYCWYKLVKENVNWRTVKIWIIIILMAVVGVFLNLICPQPIKIIVSFLVLTIINYLVMKKEIKITIIMVLMSQLIIMLSELTFSVIVSIFLNSNVEKVTNVNIVSNLYISLVSLIILSTKIPNKIFEMIMEYAKYMKKREVINYSLMIMTVIVISTAESYMKWPIGAVLVTNTIMAVVFIFFVFQTAKTEDKCNRMSSKYQTSISSLKEYEDILDKYRISTHENKNQLRTIKNMVTDQNVIKYINALLDEKSKNNYKVMKKTLKIPDGGLRAIIHAKLCKIDELNINYKLDIATDVRTVDIIDMDEFLIRDACMILGVYLDNAIDGVKELKNREICIELYIMDKQLCIDVTNNFEGTIDLSKINKPKYTSKGEGHGYGLALVSEIVKDNKKIANECEINGNRITQRLMIKM